MTPLLKIESQFTFRYKQALNWWKSKTQVTSYELRVQINELQVQIHELRVQIYELED